MDQPGHPDLGAQLRAARPNDYAPHLGRDAMDHAHAVYVIVQSLGQLGLSRRLPTLLQWLGRFDGFEAHLPDECDPAICVRQTLLRHVADLPPADGATAPASAKRAEALWQHVVQDLLDLDFVHYRSYWGPPLEPRVHWHPLSQAWLSFLECGQPEEHLCTWWPVRASAQLLQQHAGFLLQGWDDGDRKSRF